MLSIKGSYNNTCDINTCDFLVKLVIKTISNYADDALVAEIVTLLVEKLHYLLAHSADKEIFFILIGYLINTKDFLVTKNYFNLLLFLY